MVSGMTGAKTSAAGLTSAMNASTNLDEELQRATRMASLANSALDEAKNNVKTLAAVGGASAREMLAAEKEVDSLSREYNQANASVEKLKGSINSGGSGNLKNIDSDVRTLGNDAQKTGSMFKSMLGATLVSGAVFVGLNAVKSGISGMVTELNSSSKAWQTFEGNMNQMGASSSSIQSAKADMQQYAQATIYSASDMASTYAQLAAVGTKNTGDLVKGFGGLAAASEDPTQAMKTLSQQATQMAAKPKVQWEDFKLMLEQTPAGMAAVAKSMDMTTGKLIKGIQDGTVSTQEFFNAISKTGTNKSFSKMATQFKTVDQAVDGMKETLTNKLQPAFDRVSQIGIKAVEGLTNALSGVDFTAIANSAINFGTTVATAIGGAWQTFKDTGAVDAAIGAFNQLKGAVGYVIQSFSGGSGGVDIFKVAVQTLGGAVNIAAGAISLFAGFVKSIDPATMQAIGTGVAAFAGSLLALRAGVRVINATKGAFTAMRAVANLGGLVGNIARFAARLIGISVGNTAVATTSAGAAAGTKAVGSAAGASGKQMLAAGAAAVMIGAGFALAAAGVWVMADAAIRLAGAGSGAVGVMAMLGGAVVGFAVTMAAIAPALTAGAVGMLAFGGAVVLVGVGIAVASFGISLLAAQLPLIAAYGLAGATALFAIGSASLMVGAGAGVAGLGLGVLAAGLTAFGLAAVLAGAGATVLGAGLVVLGAGATVAGAGLTVFGAGAVVAGAGIMTLATSTITAMAMFGSAISNGINNAVGFIRGGVSSILGAVSSINLGGAGQAIMDGFLGGLKSGWTAVTGFVSGIASWIKEHKGPISYDRKLLVPAGGAIMGGFNKSLNDNFAPVKRDVASYAGQISDSFGTADLNGSVSASMASNAGVGSGTGIGSTSTASTQSQQTTYVFQKDSISINSDASETGEQLVAKLERALQLKAGAVIA